MLRIVTALGRLPAYIELGTESRAIDELPTSPNSQETEQLKTEYAALMEEYKTLRSEVVQGLLIQHQTFNFSVTAIGVVIGATATIIEKHAAWIFVPTSLLFYGIAWTHLKYIRSTNAVSQYINKVIRPAVAGCIRAMAPNSKHSVEDVLGWESGGNKLGYANSKAFLSYPAEAARFAIPLMAGGGSYIAYVVFDKVKLGIPQLALHNHGLAITGNAAVFQCLLAAAQVLLFFYTIAAILMTRKSLTRKAKLDSP